MSRRDFIALVRGAAAIWPHAPAPVNGLSPALRVRRGFICLGLTISILAFVMVGADVLLEQWIEGQLSAVFVFGTACLIAAACTTLFAVIAIVGIVVSSAFSDEPPHAAPRQPDARTTP